MTSSSQIHRQVLLDILGFAQKEGFRLRGLIKSPLFGPKGNAEFLVWLDQIAAGFDQNESVEESDERLDQMVANVLTS